MAATNKVWQNNQAPTCEDDDLNGFKEENNNLIAGSGQLIDTGDHQQTHKAVSAYAHGGSYYIDSGSANVYTLATVGSKVSPPAYFDGMEVVFSAAATNTGASAITVGALAAKALVYPSGDNLLAGEVRGLCRARYSTAVGAFVLTNPAGSRGGKTATTYAQLKSKRAYGEIGDGDVVAVFNRATSSDSGGGDFLVSSLDFSAQKAVDTEEGVFVDIGGGLTAIRANVTSIKDVFFGSASDWDGAAGTIDDVPVQAALDYCVHFEVPLEKVGMSLLSQSLKYNRVVDGNSSVVTVPGDAVVDSRQNDYFMDIYSNSGGGFAVDSAITIFDTDLSNNDAALPCVQLLRLTRIKFEASSNALAAYVMSPKFLRVAFLGCEWRKIKHLTSPTILTQSIYFDSACQARRWDGVFFSSKNANFDLQVDSILMEAGGDGFDVDFPVGSSIRTTIEGMETFAIKYVGATGLTISCYHEGNGIGVANGHSIDGSGAVGVDQNEMITVQGCYLSGDGDDTGKPNVLWGDSTQSVSLNNHCTTVLHQFATNSRPTIIGDYSRLAISTNAQKAIVSISKAAAAQVEITNHGYIAGDSFAITGGDMPEIEGYVLSIVSIVDGNNFTVNVDSTTFTTYTGGASGYSANHNIRNTLYSGVDVIAPEQFNYLARLRAEFVGGQGAFARIRTVNDGVESARGLDLNQDGDVVATLPASVTPLNNGETMFSHPSNTIYRVHHKGTDGVIRTGDVTLA